MSVSDAICFGGIFVAVLISLVGIAYLLRAYEYEEFPISLPALTDSVSRRLFLWSVAYAGLITGFAIQLSRGIDVWENREYVAFFTVYVLAVRQLNVTLSDEEGGTSHDGDCN